MILAYATVLGLYICPTNVKAQKIDKSMLLIYSIVLTKFQLKNKQEKTRFYQEILLVANTTIKVVLRMLFLIFSKLKINFADQELN